MNSEQHWLVPHIIFNNWKHSKVHH